MAADWSKHRENADTHDADPGLDSNMGYFKPSQIVAAPHVWAFLNDRRMLETAKLYIGSKPMLDNFGCWWSFDGKPAVKGTQRHQRDLDRLRGCKLFIYLNEDRQLLLATSEVDTTPQPPAAPILLTLPAELDPEINRLISAV